MILRGEIILQGHTGSQWQSWGLNLTPESCPLYSLIQPGRRLQTALKKSWPLLRSALLKSDALTTGSSDGWWARFVTSPSLPGRVLDATASRKGAHVSSSQIQNGLPHKLNTLCPFENFSGPSLPDPTWFHIIKPAQQSQGCFLPPRFVFIKGGAFGSLGTSSLQMAYILHFSSSLHYRWKLMVKIQNSKPLKNSS